MKTNTFLFAFALTISMHNLNAHGFDRDTHISHALFDHTGMFETTPKGSSPEGISDFEPKLVMQSQFLRDGTLSCLRISYDLSIYANKNALKKAVASCIHATNACGFAAIQPKLGDWEIMSPRCNPEYATEEAFIKWRDSLCARDKAIVNMLEQFMQRIITADFATGTYYFGLQAKTRSHARRPASA